MKKSFEFKPYSETISQIRRLLLEQIYEFTKQYDFLFPINIPMQDRFAVRGEFDEVVAVHKEYVATNNTDIDWEMLSVDDLSYIIDNVLAEELFKWNEQQKYSPVSI